jgi:hypothetical protein
VNSNQAKEILMLYRPGSADAQDPQFAEALAMVETDAGLKAWFDGHCATYEIMRARFKQIEVPAGLREQILSERRAHTEKVSRRRLIFGAATAAVAVLLLVLASPWSRPNRSYDFAAYRARMVSTALRTYGMDIETSDMTKIREYLAAKKAHADYNLPKGLQAAVPTGCVVMTWQGKTVSMICFRSGKPLPAGDKSDLFLFVADANSVPDAPRSAAPVMGQTNKLMTAGWSEGGRVYLLAASGDENFLRKYLGEREQPKSL